VKFLIAWLGYFLLHSVLDWFMLDFAEIAVIRNGECLTD